MARTRAVARLTAWMAALAGGLVAFHALGSGMLPMPPLQPAAFADWLATTDPTLAAMSVLRLVVLGLSWYLAGATTIGILARLAGAIRLVRLADALTVPSLRRLLQSALGLSLATAMVTGAAPARAQPLPLELLEESAEAEGAVEPATGTVEPRAVPEPLVAEPRVTGRSLLTTADARSAPVDEHTVVAGESFWRIAADRMAAIGEHDDRDVAVYWRRLIEHNRSGLVDPANPDLLLPGQRLELPPVSG